jgi:hypothetical protein
VVSSARREIEALYGQNNPEKLGDVDTLLAKYGEERLLLMVRKKYGVGDGAPTRWTLEYASAELKGNRELVLAAVVQDGRALQYASAELQGDREVVLAAIGQNGMALEDASAELKGDREVVLAAVAQNGLALKHASAELRRNEGIVRAAVAQDPAAEKLAAGGSLAAVQAAAAAYGIWRGAPAAAAAVAARPPLLELDGEVLLHVACVGGFGSRTLSPLACTCTRLRDQAEMMSMQLVGQRPDQGRAPRQAGQRWLAALRALEELERELGAYVSPHHEAFVVAVSKGGGKAGRRRFRLWREMNGLDDAQDETQWKPRHARAGGAPAHNWLTAALVVVAQERPKLEVCHYMTQPLVELYGGCMVVLKVS